MPYAICPRCKSGFLQQIRDTDTFNCKDCKTTFNLVKMSENRYDLDHYTITIEYNPKTKKHWLIVAANHLETKTRREIFK